MFQFSILKWYSKAAASIPGRQLGGQVTLSKAVSFPMSLVSRFPKSQSITNSLPDVLARSVSDAHTLLKSVIVLGSQMEGRFEQNVTSFAKWKRLAYF